jgi:hypothetical protein
MRHDKKLSASFFIGAELMRRTLVHVF